MIAKGIFPTMVTAFDNAGNIDYKSMMRLIEKFEQDGADGIFAVCQSSEMFNLTIDEKVELASFIKNNSKIDVIASGHTQKTPEDQVEAMKKITSTGVDAVVLISNAFAAEDDSDDTFIKNLEYFLNNFKKDIPLGIYECPYPYKRLLSDRTLQYILDTERFVFLKDTSCNVSVMQNRLVRIGKAPFGLYNANVETLSETTKIGAAGFSGVVANVSVKIAQCLMKYTDTSSGLGKKAQKLVVEFSEYLRNSYYPISAKILLREMGIFNTIVTKVKDTDNITESMLNTGREYLEKIKDFEIEFDKKS